METVKLNPFIFYEELKVLLLKKVKRKTSRCETVTILKNKSLTFIQIITAAEKFKVAQNQLKERNWMRKIKQTKTNSVAKNTLAPKSSTK